MASLTRAEARTLARYLANDDGSNAACTGAGRRMKRWLAEMADMRAVYRSKSDRQVYCETPREMAPRPGLEPGTCGLTVRRSTD